MLTADLITVWYKLNLTISSAELPSANIIAIMSVQETSGAKHQKGIRIRMRKIMAKNSPGSPIRRMLKLIGIGILVVGLVAAVQFLRLHDLGPKPAFTSDASELTKGVKFIEANSLRFGYIEMGQGPLILLLHGYPETARSWHKVQTKLAESGFRAIAVFMRGYAPTSQASDYSVRSLGKDVVALIDAFGEDKAIVVGHDWGASAAYEAAFTTPEKISHLVTLSIPHPLGTKPSLSLFRRAPHFAYYQMPTAERLIWSDNFSHIRNIFKGWSPGFNMPESEFEDIRNTLKSPNGILGPLSYYHALVSNAENNAEIKPTSKITVPTLVIAGDNDGTVLLDWFKTAEPAFSTRYTFELLRDAGHFPQIEQPDAVAKLIQNFVSDD